MKFWCIKRTYSVFNVRPLAGAGIEIVLIVPENPFFPFAPSRGRELKLDKLGRAALPPGSPPRGGGN